VANPSLTPEIRKRLSDEIVFLRDTWTQLSSLFATSDETIKLLNATAPWFFVTVRRVFMREVVLGISRLTDSASSFGNPNLTIRVLLDDPAIDAIPDLRLQLTAAVEGAVTAAASVRAHRNKYIAHLDHATAMGTPATPLPDLLRTEIAGAISALESAYNLHGVRVLNSAMHFSIFGPSDADDLVEVLRGSDRWREWLELQDVE
jgi:hypothetical protein